MHPIGQAIKARATREGVSMSELYRQLGLERYLQIEEMYKLTSRSGAKRPISDVRTRQIMRALDGAAPERVVSLATRAMRVTMRVHALDADALAARLRDVCVAQVVRIGIYGGALPHPVERQILEALALDEARTEALERALEGLQWLTPSEVA